jgi:hypothetical protein
VRPVTTDVAVRGSRVKAAKLGDYGVELLSKVPFGENWPRPNQNLRKYRQSAIGRRGNAPEKREKRRFFRSAGEKFSPVRLVG